MQIPEQIRQEIAQKAPIRNAQIKKMLQMPTMMLDEQLEMQRSNLEKQGWTRKAISAYISLSPLYLENQAMQAYLRQKGDPELLGLLPNLETLDELLMLAQREYLMEPKDLEDLKKMLTPTAAQ
jgi:hypothetical protein